MEAGEAGPRVGGAIERGEIAETDQRLAGRQWVLGDQYTIADIATFPMVRNLIGFYGAGELVGIAGYPQVLRVLQVFNERPAVVRGLEIPRRD